MSTQSKTVIPSGVKNRIVLVPFPFSDLPVRKVRPALCLTEPFGKFLHVVVAFISSKIEPQLEETEIEINPQIKSWEETGLIVPSVIKLHKLVSIPEALIFRDLGNLPKELAPLVEQRLKSVFGLK